MTRGTILIVTKTDIIQSYEKNGAMMPDTHGIDLAEDLARAKTLDDAKQVLADFADEYMDEAEKNDKGILTYVSLASGQFDCESLGPLGMILSFAPEGSYWPQDVPEGKPFRNLPGFSSDYSYIKNCTEQVLHIIDNKGRKVSLLPNDVAVFCFGERRIKFFAESYD